MGAVLAVAAGGALGSIARYAVTLWMQSWLGPNAWGTFTVNVTGSFVLGAILGLTAFRVPVQPAIRDGLTVGVLGGYTTFSTLMYQAVRQFEVGEPLTSAANLLGSVAVGMVAMMLGLALGRAV